MLFRSIDGYVATGRARDAVAGTAKDEAASAPSSTQPAEAPTRVEAMRAKRLRSLVARKTAHSMSEGLRNCIRATLFNPVSGAQTSGGFTLESTAK